MNKEFTDSLEAKGFFYNKGKEWWQRTWRTHTPEGEERCLEVFKEGADGEWSSIMYGDVGGFFYEEKVGEKK